MTLGRRRSRIGLALAMVGLLSGCAGSLDHKIDYGLNHYQMGLHGQAIPALVSAAESLDRPGPVDPRLPRILVALGDMASAESRPDLAEAYYKKALDRAEHLVPTNSTLLRNALVHGGNFLLEHGRPPEAVPWLERAVRVSELETGMSRVLYAIDLDNLGQALVRSGRYEEGLARSRQALEVVDPLLKEPEAKKAKGIILYNLARAYEDRKLTEEARTHYRQALEVLPMVGSRWEVRTLVKAYAAFLRAQGQEDEAKALDVKFAAVLAD